MAHIDHVFVFSRANAPERAQLQAAGMQVGAEREHRGQGTANACFGFADCYLELIWLADEAAANHALVKPLGLQERANWQNYRASPFGVCVRTDDDEHVPFATWSYTPDDLPDGVSIDMGCNSGVIGEPMLFRLQGSAAEMMTHAPFGEARLQHVQITTPELAPMSPLHDLQIRNLTLQPGDAHLMELTLAMPATSTAATGVLDLRPGLPLIIRW